MTDLDAVFADLDAITQILDNKAADHQANVIANLLAQFALANADNGVEPYETVRRVRQMARTFIEVNLRERGLLLKLPKGAKAN